MEYRILNLLFRKFCERANVRKIPQKYSQIQILWGENVHFKWHITCKLCWVNAADVLWFLGPLANAGWPDFECRSCQSRNPLPMKKPNRIIRTLWPFFMALINNCREIWWFFTGKSGWCFPRLLWHTIKRSIIHIHKISVCNIIQNRHITGYILQDTQSYNDTTKYNGRTPTDI